METISSVGAMTGLTVAARRAAVAGGGGCRRRRIQDRPSGRRRRAAIQQRQRQRQAHEDHRQHRRGAGQQVGGAAARHERAHALGAADAQATALAALDQHDADQGQGDEQMDNQQDSAQRAGLSNRLGGDGRRAHRRARLLPGLSGAGNR